MKGELSVCANPKCAKEFIKSRYNQKCCGNASCRTLYNRYKNGQPLLPTSFKKSSTNTSLQVNSASSGKASFQANAANSVLTHAIAPAVVSAIGRGSFVGNVAASVVTGAVVPMIREFISSGNKVSLSSIDNEMNRWIAEKEYFTKERENIKNGVFPYWSVGGLALGGSIGYFSIGKPIEPYTEGLSKKRKRKVLKKYKKQLKKYNEKRLRNALVGAALLGGGGYYYESKQRQSVLRNSEALIDYAEKKIFEANENIERLRGEKARMNNWIDKDILVEQGEGIYSVNPQISRNLISADDYLKVKIPQIEFKGAYRLLLSKAREKFYKLVGGLPEQGKTSYCVKFATYYAENHGKVIYLPSEQSGANADFQQVIRKVEGKGFDIDMNAHKYNLLQLLAKVKGYDLVILDSINDMKLSPSDVKAINEKVAVMGVMQSTKSGGFKGGQDYLHDCDKFIYIEKLTASASKSRGTDPNEEREIIPIEKLTW